MQPVRKLALTILLTTTLSACARHELLKSETTDPFTADAIEAFHGVFPHNKRWFAIYPNDGAEDILALPKGSPFDLESIDCEESVSFHAVSDWSSGDYILFAECHGDALKIRKTVEGAYAWQSDNDRLTDIMEPAHNVLGSGEHLYYFSSLILGHGIAVGFNAIIVGPDSAWWLHVGQGSLCEVTWGKWRYCKDLRAGMMEAVTNWRTLRMERRAPLSK